MNRIVRAFITITAAVPFSIGLSAGAFSSSAIVINEVMFNPDGDENAREFVELFNRSGAAQSLEGYKIGDGSGYDVIVPVADGGWLIPAGGFAVILDPDYFVKNEPYASLPSSAPLFIVTDSAIGLRGLSNSAAEPVTLVAASGDTIDVVIYDIACPPGHSWERVDSWSDDNQFAPSLAVDGTPGAENSVVPPAVNPELDAALITILPETPLIGGQMSFDIRYRNAGRSTIEQAALEMMLEPDHRLGTAVFSETLPGAVSEPTRIVCDTLPGGRLSFLITLRADEVSRDTLAVSLDIAVPAGTLLLNEVMAAPSKGDPEWVEIVNTSGYPVDPFGYGIGDASNTKPVAVAVHAFIPAGGYAVLASKQVPGLSNDAVFIPVDRLPSLNNDGDSVYLADYTGALADSMNYEKTTAGYSIERMLTAGSSWDISTDPSGSTPGRANSIVFDPITAGGKVLLAIEPNPVGGDTRISYRLPFPLARVNLTLYDRRGRHIATIRDGEESGAEWSSVWQAVEDGARLPAGPYILILEALDKRTGNMVTERKTLVVGSNL